MEWLTILLGGFVAIFAGINIFQFFAFRAYKKKYKAEAEKDEAIAAAEKQSALEQRLESIEKLYVEQGKLIDDLREKVLSQGRDLIDRDEKIMRLEKDNENLTKRVDELTKEVEAYRVNVNK